MLKTSNINLLLMMTPSDVNIFPVTDRLWRESAGHRWFPLIQASDTVLWCLLWSTSEHRFNKQSRRRGLQTPWRSLWRHCNDFFRSRKVALCWTLGVIRTNYSASPDIYTVFLFCFWAWLYFFQLIDQHEGRLETLSKFHVIYLPISSRVASLVLGQ